MDCDAVELLYKEYFKEAYLYTLSLCHNPSIAEDIVSDAFLKVILSVECADRNIKLWILRVCKNLWIDYIRKNKKISQVPFDELDAVGSMRDLNERMIASERAKAVYRAVMGLPQAYQESIVLFYYLNIRQNEIAKLLNVSDGTARTIIYRARKMLKSIIEEDIL